MIVRAAAPADHDSIAALVTAAFTRAFKRELGVPPATWRKQIA